MKNITQHDFDKIVSHTVRIELKDGTILHFMVPPDSKRVFRDQLLHDTISDYDKDFLWLYILKDRLVLINEKDIIRITFCFDISDIDEAAYYDNFKVLERFPLEFENEQVEKENEFDVPVPELDLPSIIIKHQREKEDSEIVYGVTIKTEGFYGNVSYYFGLSKNEVSGFDFDYYEDENEWVLLTSKYFQFMDEDGEENFMLLKNLSVIEIKRSLIMSDETLALYLTEE